MKRDFCIYAFGIKSDGSSRALTHEEIQVPELDDEYEWLHLNATDEDTREFIERKSDLDPLVIDALLALETRPRILLRDQGMLIILRAMNLHDGAEPDDMISIRIWLEPERVITTRRRDIKAIQDITDCIDDKKAPASPSDFLIMITDRLFERMEPYFSDLEERISRAEELLAVGDYDAISEDAALVRKRTAVFKRYVVPQKALLEALLKAEYSWLEETHKEHLAESLDMVTRYVEELQELSERSQILNDELNNMHGRRLNDITYIFSIAATIFLPLSFLTGLMGINIGGMPGVNSNMAFWAFTGLCILIIAIQVIVFRKLKWF